MKQTRLTTFGLILVGVPVVLQLVLLSWMLSILWSNEQAALQARESRNRIARLNDSMMSLSEFSFLLISARESVKKEDVLKEVSEIEKNITTQLDKLADPENQEHITKVKSVLTECTATAGAMLDQLRSARSEEERMSLGPRYFQFSKRFADAMSQLIEFEKKKRSQTVEISEVDRSRIHDGLIAFVAVNLSTSVLMSLFFASRINTPINRISNNLELLSQKKTLLPASDRDDELGSLDRLIHKLGAEISKAHERERSLIEKAADMICSLDESGNFLTVNPMANRMLNIKQEDLVARRLNELTRPEDSFAADELIRRSISSNDFQTAELTLCKADGALLETRWSCLWSDQESSLFCVAHDVTKEKELERMKQDFMNMISHDLRSPLSSVMGGLIMLTKGLNAPLTPSFREEVESAVRSSEKLIGFIDDLLDFQKLSAGQMPLEICENRVEAIIAEALELINAFAKSRAIQIKFDTNSDLAVACDKQKISQVIVNLLSNAVKFAPENSTVNVTAIDDGNSVRFSVSDEGPGVPEDLRVGIFEAFQQTKETKHQGTGLGLAICKMIVEGHGGTIGVRDAANATNTNAGCEFWFTIPKEQKPV